MSLSLYPIHLSQIRDAASLPLFRLPPLPLVDGDANPLVLPRLAASRDRLAAAAAEAAAVT